MKVTKANDDQEIQKFGYNETSAIIFGSMAALSLVLFGIMVCLYFRFKAKHGKKQEE